MPQDFYRPISLQALQIECEYGEIKDKFRENLSLCSLSKLSLLLGTCPVKDGSFFIFCLYYPLILKVADMFYYFVTVDAEA